MLAKLELLLPFSITVPDNQKFTAYQYSDSGYTVAICPPIKTTQPQETAHLPEVTINGKPAFQANGLRVFFHKENFDRRKTILCDPPTEFIKRTVNSFLQKLRFVVKGSKIKPIDFPMVSWNLQYLNDDQSELEESENLVTQRFARHYTASYTALPPEAWDEVFKLGIDYIVPKWESLILDAHEALPEIGQSIVLASTALEVFISHILNEVSKKSSVPDSLWEWINNRNWWLQNPATDEQYDVLLKLFIGKSLKQESELWQALQNLKKARNSFVHEGVAKIGEAEIDYKTAVQLLHKARNIIRFVRENLPAELQWPVFSFRTKIETTLKFS